MNLTIEQKYKLFEKLQEFVSDRKKHLYHEIIQYRTHYLTLVLEDIYQPQNASAVLRTADCFGIQDVHIIENRNKYKINPEVELGASKWLSIHRYNKKEDNTLDALNALKTQGYRIVATMPHCNEVLLPDMDMKQKTAIFFGNELQGLSKTVQEYADIFVKIPMYGFTESYNISVSAALCMQELSKKMKLEVNNWRLSEEELLDIKINWIKAAVKQSEGIEENLFASEFYNL